jgi:hypothetical protein
MLQLYRARFLKLREEPVETIQSYASSPLRKLTFRAIPLSQSASPLCSGAHHPLLSLLRVLLKLLTRLLTLVQSRSSPPSH